MIGALRTWIFVRSLGTGDTLAAPLAAPDLVSVGSEEDALLEQKIALPEHLGGAPAATIARFSFPEGTVLRAVDIVVPRDELPRKLAIHTPIALAVVVVPVVPTTITRPSDGEARVRFEGWVFILPLREICHVVVDERYRHDRHVQVEAERRVGAAIDARVTSEVRRLWIAREGDAFGWLALLPARRQALVPLELSFPRGEDGPTARAEAMRKALVERQKRAVAVEILNSVGRPLHLARKPFVGDPMPVVGRDRERALLGSLLSATRDGDRQAVLLVGRERVGKTALLHAWLDERLTAGESPLAWSTSGAALIAGMSGLGQWQERVRRVMQAAADLDAVLVLDDVADLFSERGRSTVDVPSAMRPFLEQGRVRFVAELHEDRLDRIERGNLGFFAALSKIRVPPLDAVATHEALAARVQWDQRHAEPKIPVGEAALAAIVDLADRHLAYECFPGKAIRLYEEVRAAVAAASSTPKPIGTDVVHEVVSLRTGVPAFLLRDDRSLAIDDVIAQLRARVIGQEDALRRVAEVVAVVKAGLQPRGKPLATFLFVGPTGVGKTELARALADLLFGAGSVDAEDRLLRFDMSEFMDPLAAERLIRGTDRDEGLLTRAIRKQPFAVLLLDEIEKAHPRVLDLLLQVAGEGRLTDAAGKTAYFHDAIVILTSNLGAADRRASLGFDRDANDVNHAKDDRTHYERAARAAIRPEFLNRLDRIVVFGDLGREHRQTLVALSIAKVRRRRGLFEGGINLTVSEAAITALGDSGYSRAYGARSLRRHVEERLVAPMARLLSGYGDPGDVDVDVHLAGEPVVPCAASEDEEDVRVSLVRRPTKKVTHEHTRMRRIAEVRRELARASKLDRIAELREQVRFLVAQLGHGQPTFDREHGRLQTDHHRLDALMVAIDRAVSDAQVVEETAIEAFFRGEKLGELVDESERVRRDVAGPLVRALIAQERRRDEVTLLVQELDEGRTLDVWLGELIEVLEARGWALEVNAQETDSKGKRRWGAARDVAFAHATISEKERKPLALLVSLTGPDALLASLERGVHRFVGTHAKGPAHLLVQVAALRTTITVAEAAKLLPESPATASERARQKPSRIHDRSGNGPRNWKLMIAPLGEVAIERSWAAFDEVALAILLGFERGKGDRDTAFHGRLGGDDEEIRALLEAKGKIAAIKRYRELTGVGLKEAKDAVEAFERRVKDE